MQMGYKSQSQPCAPVRLKTRKEFLRVQRTGARFRGKFITFMARGSGSAANMGRFGLVTPKTMGKAHDRNLIKRRLRHIVSLHPEILNQRDVVILASSQALDASFDELKRDVLLAEQKLPALTRRRHSAII